MNTLHDLRQWCIDQGKKHPELQSDISECYGLCVSEIEEGGSIQNEIESCVIAIEQMIEQL